MATPTYDLLDSEVLASAAATVTFTSIPGTYRDLFCVVNAFSEDGTLRSLRGRFNSDGSINYSRVDMFGNGVGTGSVSATANHMYLGRAAGTGQVASTSFSVMDYSTTDKHKTVLERDGTTADATRAAAFRWGNTAAINEIIFYLDSGNFAAGSTFYLYGIAG